MEPYTARILDKGQKNSQLLIQKQYSPVEVGKQIALLYCGTHGLLARVPLDKIVVFEEKFLHVLESSHRKTVLEPLNRGEINDEIASIIESVAEQIAG
jgi:F-type H+-transporting ATPase subunit alpha